MEAREFIVGTRQQREWGWKVITASFFTGIGAGLFLIASIAGFVLGMVVGWILVAAGCLFLLWDLHHRWPAWRLLSRPQSSWMSRGTIGLLAFLVLAFVHIIYLVIQPNGWTSLGAPWMAGPAWVMVLGIVVGAAALFVASYPGFLLGNSRPISFWSSAYLPALFLLSGLLGGLGIMYLLPLNWDVLYSWWPVFLQSLGVVLIILEMLLLLGLILLGQTQATRESLHIFTRGSFRFHFWVGVFGIGLILPLVVLGVVSVGVGIASLLLIEGAFHLIGAYLLRYIIFRAGVYVSPV